MKPRNIRQALKKSTGFTLVEILIVLSILGLITGAVTTSMYQVYQGNARDTTRMTAITDIQNAVHWITPDVQMAQQVNAASPKGFPLTLSWVDWDGNSIQVIYKFQSGQLQRNYSENNGPSTVLIVAQHLDLNQTTCTVNNAMLTFKLTSSLNAYGAETNSFSVKPRTS